MATSPLAVSGPSPSAPARPPPASVAQVTRGTVPAPQWSGAGCQPGGHALMSLCSPGTGEVTVDEREVTLPFTGAELNVRQASSSFLLLQTFGAHVLWGLEAPTTYITLQPAFADKVSQVPGCATLPWWCPVADPGWDAAVRVQGGPS